MILRVQAMYRGSRIVLGVLLLFYVPTMILLFISTGFYYNPNTMSGVYLSFYCRNYSYLVPSEHSSSARCLVLQYIILLHT